MGNHFINDPYVRMETPFKNLGNKAQWSFLVSEQTQRRDRKLRRMDSKRNSTEALRLASGPNPTQAQTLASSLLPLSCFWVAAFTIKL